MNSSAIWYEGLLNNKPFRSQLRDSGLDQVDAVKHWFESAGTLATRLRADGGSVWSSFLVECNGLGRKLASSVETYDNNPPVQTELNKIKTFMVNRYDEIRADSEKNGILVFIQKWGENVEVKRIVGSQAAEDLKTSMQVSKANPDEKFLHLKSSLALKGILSASQFSMRKRSGNGQNGPRSKKTQFNREGNYNKSQRGQNYPKNQNKSQGNYQNGNSIEMKKM